MLAAVIARSNAQLSGHRAWLRALQASTNVGHSAGLAFDRNTFRLRGPERLSQWPRAFASGRSLIRRHKTVGKSQREKPAVTSTKDARLERLVNAIEAIDVPVVIQFYNGLQPKDLTREHVWRLVQCLHEALRRIQTWKGEKDPADLELLTDFAQKLSQDFARGSLVPDNRAFVHLLSIFKESRRLENGVALWEWLRAHPEAEINADVYGAAIEMLVVNGVPLEELEALYQEALARFPAGYQAYHFSHNALVPDRERAMNVTGLSMVLLQGITIARLLSGDAKNAYLALDTALRLYPGAVPARFFTTFINERPLVEAYAVFAIACRAGISLPAGSIRSIMLTLRRAIDPRSPSQHIHCIRSMLSMVYMHKGADGSFIAPVVNELLIAIAQILRLEGVAGLEDRVKRPLVEVTLLLVTRTLELCARLEAQPTIVGLNAVIANVAGHGQSKAAIGVVLNAMEALQLSPTVVTQRIIVGAAGQLRDEEFVRRAWQNLQQAREEVGSKVDFMDVLMLVNAARMCGAQKSMHALCAEAASQLHERSREIILTRLTSSSEEPGDAPGRSLDVDALLDSVTKLQEDFDFFDEAIEERPLIGDFDQQKLPVVMYTFPEQETLPDREQQQLYDEMTSESAKQDRTDEGEVIGKAASADRSSTNIPFGKLRYEHWKSLNYLLKLADLTGREHSRLVDAAIAREAKPPQVRDVDATPWLDVENTTGLSDSEVGDAQYSLMSDEDVQRLRHEIMRLRGASKAL